MVLKSVSLARKAAQNPVFPAQQQCMTNAAPAMNPAQAIQVLLTPVVAAVQRQMNAALKPVIILTNHAVQIIVPAVVPGLPVPLRKIRFPSGQPIADQLVMNVSPIPVKVFLVVPIVTAVMENAIAKADIIIQQTAVKRQLAALTYQRYRKTKFVILLNTMVLPAIQTAVIIILEMAMFMIKVQPAVNMEEVTFALVE